MSIKKIVTILVIFIVSTAIKAQSTVGDDAFSVLNLYNSANMTARGFDFMPGFNNEVSSALTNPAVLSKELNNQISLTYTDLFAGAYQGAVAFAHNFNSKSTFGFGLQYINYGNFPLTEANGDDMGTFSVSDYMLTIGWGIQAEKNLYLGVNFKPLFSHYESYSSFAVAFDFAATFVSNDGKWQAGTILKNVGKQIKSFTNERDTLPLDLQIGVMKKLSYAPVVVYVVADNLTKWNIRENDPLRPRDEENFDGSVRRESPVFAFADKLFRHAHISVDIIPSKVIYFSLGYSWRQHQEMKIDDSFSLAGLSYGLGIKWRQFSLNYARNEYHSYGSPNYITLGYKF